MADIGELIKFQEGPDGSVSIKPRGGHLTFWEGATDCYCQNTADHALWQTLPWTAEQARTGSSNGADS